MTYEEFIEAVEQLHREEPRWRWGQCLFNKLMNLRPDLSERLRGTNLDPFYFGKDHPVTIKAVGWIKEKW